MVKVIIVLNSILVRLLFKNADKQFDLTRTITTKIPTTTTTKKTQKHKKKN